MSRDDGERFVKECEIVQVRRKFGLRKDYYFVAIYSLERYYGTTTTYEKYFLRVTRQIIMIHEKLMCVERCSIPSRGL